MSYELGQHVMVDCWDQMDVELKGVIVSREYVRGDGYTYEIMLENGETTWYSLFTKTRIRRIEKQSPKFKVGDIVKEVRGLCDGPVVLGELKVTKVETSYFLYQYTVENTRMTFPEHLLQRC